MRLDIATEAAKLAGRINGTNRVQGGRRCVGSQRLVMFLDGSISTYGIDTNTARYMMENKPHRIVGVYSHPVTAEQLAEEDLLPLLPLQAKWLFFLLEQVSKRWIS